MRGIVFASTTALSVVFAFAAFAASNTIYLGQSGNSQKAEITQGGSGNFVGRDATHRFTQDNGWWGGAGFNKLKVDQAGTGNSIGWSGESRQSGTQNNAEIRQRGSGNGIELQQDGTNNGNVDLRNNYGSPKGGIDQAGTNNALSVVESGDSNTFNIKQLGDRNTTNLKQWGTSQQAVVRQSRSDGADSNIGGKLYPIGGAHNTVTIDQGLYSGGTAFNNFAYAAQGGGDWNTISIAQDGGQQIAVAWQDSGNNNTIDSRQSGGSNKLGDITSTTSPFYQIGSWNTLLNVQTGISNSVSGEQNGTGNRIENNQYGVGGKATYSQIGSGGNRAYSYQFGAGELNATQATGPNYLLNTQYDVATATISQTGTGHSSVGYQANGGAGIYKNSASVAQTGNNNTSAYSQVGYSNSLTLLQSSSYNESTIDQTGAGNNVLLTQSGQSNNSIISQNGASNGITLTQSSASNVSNLVQNGSNNVVTITQ